METCGDFLGIKRKRFLVEHALKEDLFEGRGNQGNKTD